MKPGSRVIVGNTDMRRVPYNDTFLYYLLPRYVPGTASMEFEPGLTNRRGTTLTRRCSAPTRSSPPTAGSRGTSPTTR